MIGKLTGLLAAKNPPQVVVDVHGVGYEIDVPMSTFFGLPEIGVKVVLVTHLTVREDAHLLFGFATESERAAFRLLLKVSGIGPKVALAVLSGLSVNDLADAIAAQDAARLTRIPGIGKKTAERVLLELKDKFAAMPGLSTDASASSVTAGGNRDVVQALIALGYNEREATTATRGLPVGTNTSDGIRAALKSLAK